MCNRKAAVDIIVRVTHESTTYAVYIVIFIGAHMCVVDFGNGCAYQNTLQWRHTERSGVLIHQRLDCLLNRFLGADQRKHQSSPFLVPVGEIHRWPVNPPHKGPATREMRPFDDVIMDSNVRGLIDTNAECIYSRVSL